MSTSEQLTIPAAARCSGISEAGLRSRSRVGTLAHGRVGPSQNIVVSRHDLDALLLTGSGSKR